MGAAQESSTAQTAAEAGTGGLKRKGPWSREEDALLLAYIEANGVQDCWRNLPKKAGLFRSGKSCRLRWINYLRPDVKRGDISPEEEDLIILLHKLIGNRWSLIAGRLPGRTDNEIKNYWKCHLRKRVANTGMDLSLPKKRIKKIDGGSSIAPVRDCQLHSVSGGLESSSENDAAAVPQIHLWTGDATSLSISDQEMTGRTQQEGLMHIVDNHIVEHEITNIPSNCHKVFMPNDVAIQEDVDLVECLHLLQEAPRETMDMDFSSSSHRSSSSYCTDSQDYSSIKTPFASFKLCVSPLTTASATSSLEDTTTDVQSSLEKPTFLESPCVSHTCVEDIRRPVISSQVLESVSSKFKSSTDFGFLYDFTTDEWQTEENSNCWDQQSACFDVETDFLYFRSMCGESLLNCL